MKLIGTFDDMLVHAASLTPGRVCVVYPSNAETLASIVAARKRLHAEFTLLGDRQTIEQGITEQGGNPAEYTITHHAGASQALQEAMQLASGGSVDILMKGSLDTTTMMKAVFDDRSGMKTGRLFSDVFVFEYPGRSGNRFIMITDGGITLAPTLKNKIELIDNAVEVAHALGNELPKVAVLSASEFVLPELPSSVDAAVLAKMNERGQIRGCVVDGPFALDNAVSDDAVKEKRISSAVAGRAEILLAPNIETANSLAKSTTYFAGLRLAHVIVGGRVPILIPSRADKSDAKLLSIALGTIMSAHTARGTKN